MNYITIPIKWKTDEQDIIESLGISDIKTSDSEDKEIHFTRIDCFYGFLDTSDNVKRTAIRVSGDVFVTDLAVSEVAELIAKL